MEALALTVKQKLETMGLRHQREQADRIGIPDTTYGKMLNGTSVVDAQQVEDFAVAVGMTAGDLMRDATVLRDNPTFKPRAKRPLP